MNSLFREKRVLALLGFAFVVGLGWGAYQWVMG